MTHKYLFMKLTNIIRDQSRSVERLWMKTRDLDIIDTPWIHADKHEPFCLNSSSTSCTNSPQLKKHHTVLIRAVEPLIAL
ncbi:hypothetical protein QQF64_021479 [Cirrhinus molitorella]|uniref:Uncharacterized protein n=1 Tax=Cirrhinus molitorella TaxID=172907 RepID=A0ABR3L7T0_9TELE